MDRRACFDSSAERGFDGGFPTEEGRMHQSPGYATQLFAQNIVIEVLVKLAADLAVQMALHDGGSDVTVRAVVSRAIDELSRPVHRPPVDPGEVEADPGEALAIAKVDLVEHVTKILSDAARAVKR